MDLGNVMLGKSHTLYDSICIECPLQAHPWRKDMSGCQGLRRGGGSGCLMGEGFLWGVMRTFCKRADSAQLWEYTQCHRTVHFEMIKVANLMLRLLYRNNDLGTPHRVASRQPPGAPGPRLALVARSLFQQDL